MIRSLKEFHVAGIKTSIPICLMVIKHEKFSNGNYCTHTLNEISDELIEELKIHKNHRMLSASIAAVLHETKQNYNPTLKDKKSNLSSWKTAGKRSSLH